MTHHDNDREPLVEEIVWGWITALLVALFVVVVVLRPIYDYLIGA